MKRVGALLCLVLLLAGLSQGCGVTQHNVIANKALGWLTAWGNQTVEAQQFAALIHANLDAFQNGAAFPDWGYSCGDSDASEQAHWPPFTLAYTHYLHNQCGLDILSYNAHCQKLVTFLFGIVSHQVADVLWHDLNIVYHSRQGFIQAMADTDFHRIYSTAHHIADAGGEFIVAREFDLSFIQEEWYLPADDLAAIYQHIGKPSMTAQRISDCNVILYAEVHAVKLGGEALYPYSARKSAFLADNLLDYWQGGIDDNALWTYWCWTEYLIDWVTHPTKDLPQYPLCLAQQTLFSDCPHVCPPPTESPARALPDVVDRMAMDGAIEREPSPSGGERLYSGSQFPLYVEELVRRESQAMASLSLSSTISDSDCPTLEGVPLFTSNASSAYLGASMSSGDLNGDGVVDLVVGAPGWSQGDAGVQRGAVFVLYGNSTMVRNPSLMTNLTEPFRVGRASHDRFGSATAVLDLNLDGWMDLVVSSPTTEADQLTYRGMLSVFLGQSTGLTKEPALRITSALNFTNLGSQLLTGDCNGDGHLDLLVGAPAAAHGGGRIQQEGRVYLLVADATTYTSGVNSTSTIESLATWILEGHETSEKFGSHMLLTEGARSEWMLLVGAPTWTSHLDPEAEKGALYAYDVKQLMKGSQEDAQVFALYGEDLWDQTGFSFAVGPLADTPRALAVSCPARKTGADQEQFGEVYFFDLDSLSGSLSLQDPTNLIVLRGDYAFARFGYGNQYDESSGLWWITQPRRDYGVDGNPEAGAVFAWSDGKLPIHAEDPPLSSSYCWTSAEGRSRFGETMHLADLTGDGVNEVWVAAPRLGNSLHGGVYLLPSTQ